MSDSQNILDNATLAIYAVYPSPASAENIRLFSYTSISSEHNKPRKVYHRCCSRHTISAAVVKVEGKSWARLLSFTACRETEGKGRQGSAVSRNILPRLSRCCTPRRGSVIVYTSIHRNQSDFSSNKSLGKQQKYTDRPTFLRNRKQITYFILS